MGVYLERPSLLEEIEGLCSTVSRMEGLFAVVIDQEERVIALNREMGEFWKVRSEEALGRPVLELLYLREEAPIIKAARSRTANHGMIAVPIDGGRTDSFIYAVATPIFLSGRYVGTLNIGIYTTEQVQALGVKDAFYLHPELSMISVGLDGKILELNETALRSFGLSIPEEALGRDLTEFFPPDYVPQVFSAMAEGRVLHSYVQSPLPTGLRDLDIFSTPVFDRAGALIGGLTISRDATEDVRARQQIERAWQLHVIGELAAKTTHEFRNCLAAIRCTAQMGELESKDNATKQFFSRIQEQVDSTNSLISQLLNLTRPAQPEMRQVPLSEVVTEISTLLQSKLEQHGVPLVIHAEPDLPAINGDPRLLGQALVNLINNSLEAAPAVGGEITIALKHAGGGVELVVADNGMGIPEASLSRVFEPFYTTKENGFGLGLSMVHQIVVQAHGGSITVKSRPGKGTTFRIRLAATASCDQPAGRLASS